MKNLTVVGKFLTSMALLISLGACQTAYQTSSIQNTVSGPYTASGSIVTLGLNLLNDKYYTLTREEKQKQEELKIKLQDQALKEEIKLDRQRAKDIKIFLYLLQKSYLLGKRNFLLHQQYMVLKDLQT